MDELHKYSLEKINISSIFDLWSSIFQEKLLTKIKIFLDSRTSFSLEEKDILQKLIL